MIKKTLVDERPSDVTIEVGARIDLRKKTILADPDGVLA
jgi:hypothetical protein